MSSRKTATCKVLGQPVHLISYQDAHLHRLNIIHKPFLLVK